MSVVDGLDRQHETEGSSDRAFGLVFALFFAFVAIGPIRHHGPIRGWALIVGGGFFVLAITAPYVLAPLNRLWIKLGLAIGQITTPIILFLLLLLVFTPVGFMMRQFGLDPLMLRRDPERKSYWNSRTPPGPLPETMIDQF